MNNTMFRTKLIKYIGEILATTIRPKTFDLSLQLILNFSLIDLK